MDMHVPHALLQLAGRDPQARIDDFFCSAQLSATYAADERTVWLRMHPQPRPSFNPELLRDLGTYCELLAATGGSFSGSRLAGPIEHVVLASAVPGVFNLGGDLALFMRLIEAGDRAGLARYGRDCCTVLHSNYVAHGIEAMTVSLVQGECLGGGFEAALSSDLIIAERSARFGFPEILFNLFPGMGAYSFLERRIGRRGAENLITSGKIYSACDMLDAGIVDAVVDDGTGEQAVTDHIGRTRRSRNGLLGLARARRRVASLDLDELVDVVDIWVDSALALTARDLKLMQRLVTRQDGVGKSEVLHEVLH
ncbi:MAG: crotonase/enoyl-CoA hydratase family protein [Burkholderiales bacterium]|nr:crotonase/enoyl-CoA hydratase family protein [Burkholderiales bacterium]